MFDFSAMKIFYRCEFDVYSWDLYFYVYVPKNTNRVFANIMIVLLKSTSQILALEYEWIKIKKVQ